MVEACLCLTMRHKVLQWGGTHTQTHQQRGEEGVKPCEACGIFKRASMGESIRWGRGGGGGGEDIRRSINYKTLLQTDTVRTHCCCCCCTTKGNKNEEEDVIWSIRVLTCHCIVYLFTPFDSICFILYYSTFLASSICVCILPETFWEVRVLKSSQPIMGGMALPSRWENCNWIMAHQHFNLLLTTEAHTVLICAFALTQPVIINLLICHWPAAITLCLVLSLAWFYCDQ